LFISAHNCSVSQLGGFDFLTPNEKGVPDVPKPRLIFTLSINYNIMAPHSRVQLAYDVANTRKLAKNIAVKHYVPA